MSKKRRKLNKDFEKKIYSSKKNVELVLAKIYDIDDEDIQKEYMSAFNGGVYLYEELKIASLSWMELEMKYYKSDEQQVILKLNNMIHLSSKESDYYLENIQLFFQKLKDCLEPNALIFFDYWSEKLVKKNPPKTTKKFFLFNEFKATRISKGKIIKNKVKVDLVLNIIKENKTKSFDETHNVGFYDIRSLVKTIQKFGYKKKNIGLNKFEKLINSKSQWEKFCLLKYEKKNTLNTKS